MMTSARKWQITITDLLRDIVSPELCSQLMISGLSMDSREVRKGDCFVAVKGAATDGGRFIDQAIQRGAVAVLIDEEISHCSKVSNAEVPLLKIRDLSNLVSEIAGRFYGHPSRSMDLVAFTGTNGKTTCSRLYAQLLAEIFTTRQGSRSAFVGTTGYAITQPTYSQASDDLFDAKNPVGTALTTPDAVNMQRILAELQACGADRVALEASSHSLQQQRIAGLVIDTAVFTNLSRDHLDYHGSLEHYAAAKARLFAMSSLKQAVINQDDTVGREILADLQPHVNAVTFSLESPVADVYCTEMNFTGQGVTASVVTPWGQGEIKSSLLGKFNLANLLAVIAAAGVAGIGLRDILRVIPLLTPVPGRMELVSAELKPRVIVDYAHTPDALEKALQALRGHCTGQLWVVFGCGGDRDVGKRAAMGEIAQRCADRVVVTSDNPRTEPPQQIAQHILEGIQVEVDVELDRRQAIISSISKASAEDIVLIAGKGHESYQIIGVDPFPFSDQEEAKTALQNLQNSPSKAAWEGAR
jgi:UDP-N-acetylmuramoyl-L-alanyl-D-glutamate--2,6-diaminopimelate ligase